MEALGVLLFLLCMLLSVLALWTLALLASEERWLLFAAAILLWPIIGLWLLRQRRPRPQGEDLLRLGLYGLVLSGSLFLPIWVSGIIFFILLGAELQMIIYQTVNPSLYPSQKSAATKAPEASLGRAGLLEERR